MSQTVPGWQHFEHMADIGVRGNGRDRTEAYEQAAVAMTAIITDPGRVVPRHPDLPDAYRETGQPVLIGGTMGTESYILAGTGSGTNKAFGSACHGAGRAMSRRQANRQWQGRAVQDELAARGIEIRSPSPRGIAEEAPGAYKDVTAAVEAAEGAGLARPVARLVPLVCIKG